MLNDLKELWALKRDDNKDKVISFAGTALGLFISVILSSLLKEHPVAFYVFFALSLVFYFAFMFLAASYVVRVHNIYAVLGNDGSLIQTCGLLARFNRQKKYKNHYSLESLTVEYLFLEDYKEGDRKWFPFRVTYHAKGKESVGEFFYTLLSSPVARRKNRIHFKCFSDDDKQFRISNITTHGNSHIVTKRIYRVNDGPIDYKIQMKFDNDSGIELNRLSRLLILSDNFSDRPTSNAKIKINLIFKKEVYDEMMKTMKLPLFRTTHIGTEDSFYQGGELFKENNKDKYTWPFGTGTEDIFCKGGELYKENKKIEYTWLTVQTELHSNSIYAIIFAPDDSNDK